jgi:hypothetical protein
MRNAEYGLPLSTGSDATIGRAGACLVNLAQGAMERV